MITLDSLAVVAICLFGLPHGALDGAVIFYYLSHVTKNEGHENSRVGCSLHKHGVLVAIVAYVFILVLTMVLWYAYPQPALLVFLLASIAHFGEGDAHSDKSKNLSAVAFRAVQVLAHGGIIPILVPLARREAVEPIFELLACGPVPSLFYFLHQLRVLWYIAVVFYVYVALFSPKHEAARRSNEPATGLRSAWFCLLYLPQTWMQWHPSLTGEIPSCNLSLRCNALHYSCLELLTLAVLAHLLPPLPMFAFYFVSFHSSRHTWRVWELIGGPSFSKHLRLTIGLTALTLVAGVFGFMCIMLIKKGDALTALSNFDSALFQVVFIGLASLTAPHMLLVDLTLPSLLRGRVDTHSVHKAASLDSGNVSEDFQPVDGGFGFSTGRKDVSPDCVVEPRQPRMTTIGFSIDNI
eukprot:gb/GEZN01008096.1/.p1 GENE.gb/GEZN01008096.1/~~gb/GEZN01008096.1/.p1  ORF type:complete len:409 (+),score=9.02 gb/GEZN01008096.1/:65-1291(+)